VRQIVVADITRVQTSCGFAVPLMQYESQRDTLIRWAEAKGEDGLADYWQEKNASSVDGLPTPLAATFEESVDAGYGASPVNGGTYGPG
jgi:hypothetical protein